MKKLLLITLSIFSLIGCVQIEDQNGPEDYSIVTISDAQIIKGSSYSGVSSYTTSSHTNEYVQGTMKSSKFSGVQIVSTIRFNKSSYNYDINCNVEIGNFIVAIVSNDKILKKIEANSNIKFTLSDTEYQHELKIVGESANFYLEYYIS